MILTLTASVAGRTHIGLVRSRNEDSIHLGRHLVVLC